MPSRPHPAFCIFAAPHARPGTHPRHHAGRLRDGEHDHRDRGVAGRQAGRVLPRDVGQEGRQPQDRPVGGGYRRQGQAAATHQGPRQRPRTRSGVPTARRSTCSPTARRRTTRRGSRRCGRCWLGRRAAAGRGHRRCKDAVTGFDYAPKADRIFYTVDATADRQGRLLRAPQEVRQARVRPRQADGQRDCTADTKDDGDPGEGDRRQALHPRVRRDARRQAHRDGHGDRRHGGEVRGREPRGCLGGRPDDADKPGKIVTPPTDVYRAKAASPHAWLENLAWNPDGTRFAFCAIFDAYPTEIIIGELKDGKWTTTGCRDGRHRRFAVTALR